MLTLNPENGNVHSPGGFAPLPNTSQVLPGQGEEGASRRLACWTHSR